MAAAPDWVGRETPSLEYPPAHAPSPASAGEPHEQRRQALRQALYVVHHGVMAGAEDAAHVVVGVGIERQAIGGDAAAREFFHRLLGVGAEILRVAHVDVGGLPVAHQQDEFFLLRLAQQETRAVAQGAAHAGRETALHAGELGLHFVVVGLIEILEAEILHVMAAVRGEAVDGEGIADDSSAVASRASCSTGLSLSPSFSLVDSERASKTSTARSRVLRMYRILMRGSGVSPMRRSTIARSAASMSISSPSSWRRWRTTPRGCMASIRCSHRPPTGRRSIRA